MFYEKLAFTAMMFILFGLGSIKLTQLLYDDRPPLVIMVMEVTTVAFGLLTFFISGLLAIWA